MKNGVFWRGKQSEWDHIRQFSDVINSGVF